MIIESEMTSPGLLETVFAIETLRALVVDVGSQDDLRRAFVANCVNRVLKQSSRDSAAVHFEIRVTLR